MMPSILTPVADDTYKSIKQLSCSGFIVFLPFHFINHPRYVHAMQNDPYFNRYSVRKHAGRGQVHLNRLQEVQHDLLHETAGAFLRLPSHGS